MASSRRVASRHAFIPRIETAPALNRCSFDPNLAVEKMTEADETFIHSRRAAQLET